MDPDVARFRKIYTDLVADGEDKIPEEDAPRAAALIMEYQDACELMKSADDGLLSDEVDTNPGEIRKRVYARDRDWTLVIPVDASNFLESEQGEHDDDDGEREDDNCA
jgi:hypothetical protein